MTSLVEFIEARLSEDEQVAREASAETWIHDDRVVAHGHPTWTADYQTVKPQFPDGHPVAAERIALAFPDHPMGSTVVARHIARHDPARALREVKAKRRILDDYEITLSALPHSDDPRGTTHAAADAFWAACSALAAVYSDHPDYDPSWSE